MHYCESEFLSGYIGIWPLCQTRCGMHRTHSISYLRPAFAGFSFGVPSSQLHLGFYTVAKNPTSIQRELIFRTPSSQLLLSCTAGAAEARGDGHMAGEQQQHVWAAHRRPAGSVRQAQVR